MRMSLTYEHEGLVTVLEEGHVLEFNQPDGDVVLVHEETSEEHKWNDQYWGQSNSKLLVSKHS